MLFSGKKTILLIGLSIMILLSIIFNLIPASYVPKLGIGEFRLHLLNNAVLTVLLGLFLLVQNEKQHKFVILLISGFAVLVFSSVIEFSQLYVPNRSFEMIDLAVNGLGVTVGLLLSFIIYFFYTKYKAAKTK